MQRRTLYTKNADRRPTIIATEVPTVEALLGFAVTGGAAFVTVVVAVSISKDFSLTETFANAGILDDTAASWIDDVSSPLSTLAFNSDVTS
jgi:hypothetical protein